MKFLRRISTRQLLALVAAVAAAFAGAVAIAMATTAEGPKPAPASLPVAVHDALTATAPNGVSARIRFTNNLIDGSGGQGSDPLLAGASGRLWASADGRLRIELQSDLSGNGATADSQIIVDRNRFTVFDAASNTAYEGTLPRGEGEVGANQGPPTVDQVKREISDLMRRAAVSRATPSDVAGRAAYTVRVSPKGNGGLLGGAELAWDAANGTPLRAALYARGDSSPVLELTATDISFGKVSDSVFDVAPPSGAKVTNLSLERVSAARTGGRSGFSVGVAGRAAVAKRLAFPLSAPTRLAGLPRNEVRLIKKGNDAGALVTYGQGLDGIAVLELPATASGPGNHPANPVAGELSLPTVSVNGTNAREMSTPLGTALVLHRGGVQYIVVASATPATVESAARGL